MKFKKAGLGPPPPVKFTKLRQLQALAPWQSQRLSVNARTTEEPAGRRATAAHGHKAASGTLAGVVHWQQQGNDRAGSAASHALKLSARQALPAVLVHFT